MVLVHETLSECATQMYEVSLKYLKRLLIHKVDTRKSIANDQRKMTVKYRKQSYGSCA